MCALWDHVWLTGRARDALQGLYYSPDLPDVRERARESGHAPPGQF